MRLLKGIESAWVRVWCARFLLPLLALPFARCSLVSRLGEGYALKAGGLWQGTGEEIFCLEEVSRM